MVDLAKVLAHGTKIGSLVWYDCRTANITPADLLKLFDKHALWHNYFPHTINPKHAFQKACRQAMVKAGSTSDTRRIVCKVIVDDIDKLVYGIVDLAIDEVAQSIDPAFSDRIWFDKNTLQVQCDHNHPTSQLIQQLYSELCGEYITRDISRFIVRTLERCCSVSLRDGGVIYFVPINYDADLEALQKVVNDIGDCNMRAYSLGALDANVANVAAVAKVQISDKITVLKSELEDLQQSIANNVLKGQGVVNSLEVKLKKFKEIKNRCAILTDALHLKAEDLTENLQEVESMLKRELSVNEG